MLIGELARQTECDIETIRYYEREGLLTPPPRTTSGYRRYSAIQLGELNFILHCRSLGMSLADIRRLGSFKQESGRDCGDINNLIDTQIQKVHRQLETLHLLEQQLLALRDKCHEHHAAAECGIFQTLVQASQGEPCACHTPFGQPTHPHHAHTDEENAASPQK